MRVTPERIGQYPVVCAELCGLGHAVCVRPPTSSRRQFDQWLERAAGRRGRRRDGGEETGGDAGAPDGKTVFTESGCGGCHTLADAGTTGSIGPDLDEGLAGQDEAFIRESIVDPSADVAEGFSDGIMPPNFGDTLKPAELDALVKYLAEVTE